MENTTQNERRPPRTTVRVHRQETTIAKIDERGAGRPSDFTTRVARSKTATAPMTEAGQNEHAEFTGRVARRVAKVPRTPAGT